MSPPSLHQPVIVIGMHRSGTSALVRALNTLGLYTGHDLEPNAEARFFLRLNETLLSMAGGRWDAPESMLRLLEEPELIDWLAGWLDPQLGGYETRFFLSKPGWLRHRDIRRYPHPWGWKDPRNTLTLPIWLRLFPQAKVIHVVRHGVDVAASLRTRERKLHQETLTHAPGTGPWRLTSPRCLDLPYGFSLWEQYMAAGDQSMAALPEGQARTLRFEDWLAQPEPLLHDLNTWLGLNADDATIDKVVAGLKTERGLAYLRDEELISFAATVAATSPWMQRHYS